MDDRNQELQTILHHIDRIETELRLLRPAVQVVISHHEGENHALILVDAELVNPDEIVDQPQETVQERRTIAPEGPRVLTRQQLLQEGRWRAQNWAIRERAARVVREELERLGRTARQNRD
jgi:hypothetical protein